MLLLKWEQDTIPCLLVSQSVSHLGNQWGLWETARLQFPTQAAGVVEAVLHSWDRRVVPVWFVLGDAYTWGPSDTSH